MQHENIVKFYDMFEFEGEIYMVLELCQNNSLKGIKAHILRVYTQSSQDY